MLFLQWILPFFAIFRRGFFDKIKRKFCRLHFLTNICTAQLLTYHLFRFIINYNLLARAYRA